MFFVGKVFAFPTTNIAVEFGGENGIAGWGRECKACVALPDGRKFPLFDEDEVQRLRELLEGVN